MEKRACNGCSMCCYLPIIEAVEKPENTWCKHCSQHSCKIYDARPQQCRDYFCGWMKVPSLPDHWYPKHCKMVVTVNEDSDGPNITILVHQDYPNKWRQFPYYNDLKRWSLFATNWRPRGYVHVFCSGKHWWILPDRDVLNPGPGVVTPRNDGSLDYFATGSKLLADAAVGFINGRRI